jgi:inorganic pyrophosphatase
MHTLEVLGLKINTSISIVRQIYRVIAVCITLMFLVSGCGPKEEPSVPVYGRYHPPPHAKGQEDSLVVYAVVEIPAGTVIIQTVDSTKRIAPVDNVPIDFLPMPGNYGFIAGCARMDTLSGVAVPLPVLVMMSAFEEGSMISVRPVALLSLSRGGISYPIVIAVPAEEDLRSIQARNFVDLITEYDAARTILQTWFLNYLGRGTFEFVGWHDERHARRIISEWNIKK